MSVGATIANRAMSRSEWLLLFLLILSIFINYIDRGNLSIAAPLIERELSLSPVQVGALLSSFFWTYAVLQLFGIAGWLADRFPVSIVFTSGFLIWSLATLATGLLSSFAAIYIARLVLGAGESLAYPCYSRIFATSLPQHHRGRANALLDAGSKLGPALGTFIGGLLLVQLGWRSFFVVLGVVSLLCLILWLRYASSAAVPASARQVLPPVAEMLGLRSAWGTFLGHFCGNYFWFFLLTWIPSYLVKERGLSISRMANIISVTFVAVAITTVCAGWISDRFISRGASPTKVRKSVVVSGLVVSSIILPVAFVTSVAISIALLITASMAFGAYTSNHWAITQTLAGPLMAGRWTSIQNGFGSMSGILAPWLAGFVVNATGSSKPAFVISGAIVLVGALMWGLVVERVQEVNWSEA